MRQYIVAGVRGGPDTTRDGNGAPQRPIRELAWDESTRW